MNEGSPSLKRRLGAGAAGIGGGAIFIKIIGTAPAEYQNILTQLIPTASITTSVGSYYVWKFIRKKILDYQLRCARERAETVAKQNLAGEYSEAHKNEIRKRWEDYSRANFQQLIAHCEKLEKEAVLLDREQPPNPRRGEG